MGSLGNYWQRLGYPTSGLANVWVSQRLVHPMSGLSNVWVIQRLGYPTSGLSNVWVIQCLGYPTDFYGEQMLSDTPDPTVLSYCYR